MGLITFLPAIVAIIFGHKATVTTPHARLQCRIGLSLGYAAVLIWLGFGITLFESPWLQDKLGIKRAVTAESLLKIQVPVVSDAWALLLGRMAWAPLSEARSMILQEVEKSGKPAATRGSSKTDRANALQEFSATWMHGTVIYEPAILGVGKNMEEQAFQLVIEDYLTRPTFGSYNTTVIPEKKPVIGPFYVPNLGPRLFCTQNKAQKSAANNLFNENGESEFPWAMAVRGIEWSLQGLPAIRYNDVTRLRWLLFLKPAARTLPLTLTTNEGDLQRYEKKSTRWMSSRQKCLQKCCIWDSRMNLSRCVSTKRFIRKMRCVKPGSCFSRTSRTSFLTAPNQQTKFLRSLA